MTARPTFTLRDFADAYGTNVAITGDDPVDFARNVLDDAVRSLSVVYELLWREGQDEPAGAAASGADFVHNTKHRLLVGMELLAKLKASQPARPVGLLSLAASVTDNIATARASLDTVYQHHKDGDGESVLVAVQEVHSMLSACDVQLKDAVK